MRADGHLVRRPILGRRDVRRVDGDELLRQDAVVGEQLHRTALGFGDARFDFGGLFGDVHVQRQRVREREAGDVGEPSPVGGSSGTSGAGGGGGVPSTFSRIHLPRFTGLVRVGLEVTVSVLAIVTTPPRRLSGSFTLRKSDPLTPGMP